MSIPSEYRVKSGNIEDWLQIYNRHRNKKQDELILTTDDLAFFFNSFSTDINSLLVLYFGNRPRAICRLHFSGDCKFAFLNDLCFGSQDEGILLVDDILERIRTKSSSRLYSWVTDDSSGVSELLGSFTFEPRSIHLLLRYIMLHAPTHTHQKISLLEKSALSNIPIHSRRAHSIPLRDFIYQSRLSWTPVASCNIEHESELIAYISHQVRHLGYIKFDSQTSSDPHLLLQCIKGLSKHLYEKGVREVWTEVDSHQVIKQTFLQAGFGIDSTLFQLELEIMY